MRRCFVTAVFAFVILALVIGLVLAGMWGVWLLVLLLGGLALWEFNQLSDRMGFRAPNWLLFPLGAFFAFSGTVLKHVDVALVLALVATAGALRRHDDHPRGVGRRRRAVVAPYHVQAHVESCSDAGGGQDLPVVDEQDGWVHLHVRKGLC